MPPCTLGIPAGAPGLQKFACCYLGVKCLILSQNWGKARLRFASDALQTCCICDFLNMWIGLYGYFAGVEVKTTNIDWTSASKTKNTVLRFREAALSLPFHTPKYFLWSWGFANAAVSWVLTACPEPCRAKSRRWPHSSWTEWLRIKEFLFRYQVECHLFREVHPGHSTCKHSRCYSWRCSPTLLFLKPHIINCTVIVLKIFIFSLSLECHVQEGKSCVSFIYAFTFITPRMVLGTLY